MLNEWEKFGNLGLIMVWVSTISRVQKIWVFWGSRVDYLKGDCSHDSSMSFGDACMVFGWLFYSKGVWRD